MANICGNSIHLCFVRLTRLTSAGVAAGGSNGHVVSGNPMLLTVEPEIVEGDSKNLIGGCDCINASYRGYDKLLRWNLTLQMVALEPALIELLTGAGLQVNGSTEPIGVDWPNQVLCSADAQPPVAIEAWSDLWVGDAQNPGSTRYIRWVFPMSFWQMDSFNLENDFLLPQFKGFTRSNSSFGDAYADLPTGVIPSATGGFFYDDSVPTAVCGYSTSST